MDLSKPSESRLFQRVGGSTKVTVDVRIVSSTSRNIEADDQTDWSVYIRLQTSSWSSRCRLFDRRIESDRVFCDAKYC
jgi:hypothetical protein